MAARMDRFELPADLPDLAELAPIHFIAIGGAGMSAVARIMMARGLTVTGSDRDESAVTADLRARGAQVYIGHDPSQLGDARSVVVSSAIDEGNAELARARATGLVVMHRAQALASAMEGGRPAAIAGANGKTTTTSMVVAALDAAGLNPDFACGGEIAALHTNARWTPRPPGAPAAPFVIEADESDGTFLTYHPQVAVVTNVQPDHLDFYGDFAGVQAAYDEFVNTIAPGGLLVACHDDAGSRELAARVRIRRAHDLRVRTYGQAPAADLQLLDFAEDATGLGSHSRLARGDRSYDLTLAVPGVHNALNAAAAFLVATEGFEADDEMSLIGLSEFTGARRRFEVRGEPGGVLVVDDYAHNPGKVAAVVAAGAAVARRRGGRLHVLFQPHLFSRTRDFADDFAGALLPADSVVLAPVYGAREEPFDGISSALITGALRSRSVTALADADSLSHAGVVIAGAAQPRDTVLVVGAGDVVTVVPEILAMLAS